MQEGNLRGKQADSDSARKLHRLWFVVSSLQVHRGAAFRWLRSGRSLPFYFVTTCSPAEKRVQLAQARLHWEN